MPTLTELLSLNDDCIFEIFDRMSLESLCTISQTNKRLQELAGRHFVQKNRYTYLILNLCDLTFETSVSEDHQDQQSYCNFFRRNIQNVVLHKFGFIPGVDLDNVAQFIRSNCNLNLRKIEFSCCRLSDEFGEIIKDILENVETVKFRWEYQRNYGDIFNEEGNFNSVLKYCHSLKNLVLDGYGVYKEIDALLLLTYPKLEHFLCLLDAGFKMNSWKKFLRQNSNLKALTWYFWNSKENLVKFTNVLKDNATHLERIYISFCAYFDFPSILSNLQNICDQKQFKRLEFKFYQENAGKMLTNHGVTLESLKCLRGLHMFDVPFPKLPPLVHVTTIQLSSILQQNCNFAINHLPNLEVLYVREMTNASWNFVQYFLRYSLTLKTIIINSSNLFIGIDAAKLNIERQKLPGAGVVAIYVHSCWATKTDMKHSLVKMKEVEIEYDHNNDSAPFASDCVPDYTQIKLK